MVKKRKVFFVIIGVLIILVIAQIETLSNHRYFYFNLSPSVPIGLYRTIPFDGQLKKNDLLLINPPDQSRSLLYGRGWLPKGWVLFKNVGALPGDKVYISDAGIFINNQYKGPVILFDSQGKPLPKLRGNIHIKDGYFLPLATKIPNSFDVRYFGPVSVSLIKAKVKLIARLEFLERMILK